MTTTDTPDRLLDRVRKLLAKAEDESVTPEEAQALTAKAAMLMAKYGIDRALLAAYRPESDKAGNRYRDVDPPWADVTARLLALLAGALRCQAVTLERKVRPQGRRVHVFGFESDLGRLDVLFPSVVLQMSHALDVQPVPVSRPGAWRRSYLLGYSDSAIAKVKEAEAGAVETAGHAAELVLRDRSQIVEDAMREHYPQIRMRRTVYSGNGYQAGKVDGTKVDIGGTGIRGDRRSLRS